MHKFLGDEKQIESDGGTGVLITNLGTPLRPTKRAVKQYLAEFLKDPRVIEKSGLIWWLALHGIILRIRPRRSAKAYRRIWTKHGSPLLAIGERQARNLAASLQVNLEKTVPVVLGMRYGKPAIADAMMKLYQAKVRRIIVLPLYPQYSGTTTGSTFDAISKVLQRWRWIPELHFINHYYDNAEYINALANSVQNHWTEKGKGDQLIISFHGLPKRNIQLGDPYYAQCQATAEALASALHLTTEQWMLVFQSRFGRAQWLKPYCSKTLKKLPKKGIKKIDVICPGFAADCLETLDEMAKENKAIFIKAGGEQFNYINALNFSEDHINLLANMVKKYC